jgi:hypothetical protein
MNLVRSDLDPPHELSMGKRFWNGAFELRKLFVVYTESAGVHSPTLRRWKIVLR